MTVKLIVTSQYEIWLTLYQDTFVTETRHDLPASADLFQASRRSAGNRITSRMLGLSVSSIISRSMPTPQPPVGGMPYSSARMKSWS